MNNAELVRALSQLSGRRCTHASLYVNRARFYVAMGASIFFGITFGGVIRNLIVSAAVIFLLVVASSPLSDRRIVGLDVDGVVQAKSGAIRNRPVQMLESLPISAIEVRGHRSRGTSLIRIGASTYIGARGSSELAKELERRQQRPVP